jgi:hypothetical protein
MVVQLRYTTKAPRCIRERESKTMAIEDRLRRLEDANPDLCEGRPCRGLIVFTQRRLMPDGRVEVSGEPPPPLCDACPKRDNPRAPIRHIVVKHGFPQDATPGRSWTPKASPARAR